MQTSDDHVAIEALRTILGTIDGAYSVEESGIRISYSELIRDVEKIAEKAWHIIKRDPEFCKNVRVVVELVRDDACVHIKFNNKLWRPVERIDECVLVTLVSE